MSDPKIFEFGFAIINFMNKAFIFDMDGVIVNSEQAWVKYGSNFLKDLFGAEIAEKIGDPIGMTVSLVYEKATQNGFSMNKDKYLKIYDKQAAYIYSKANITEGVEKLAQTLLKSGYKIGLVSSSRLNWINHILPKLSFSKNFKHIISVNDRSDLKPKPNPDSYLETIAKLGASPKTTVILEDSNSGIKAAKSSGAFTIGFSQNLIPEYKQTGADIYANNMYEVIKVIQSLTI